MFPLLVFLLLLCVPAVAAAATVGSILCCGVSAVACLFAVASFFGVACCDPGANAVACFTTFLMAPVVGLTIVGGVPAGPGPCCC